MWEELHLELNSKQIMLMCFKYRKIYNYQRQATSILDIHNLVYYGDNHMDAWLRAVKDICFHSHDCDTFKIDGTEKGLDNIGQHAIFPRQGVQAYEAEQQNEALDCRLREGASY